MLLGELFGPPDHAGAAFRGRRHDDFRAERTHDLAAFDRERIGHRRDERVALGRADHGQGDPGISRRGLDDGLARLDQAAPFGVVDDREREAVLDRRHRVERFDLDEHVDVVRRDAVQAHDRGVADRVEDAVVDHVASSLSGLLSMRRVRRQPGACLGFVQPAEFIS